jgi:hypothetical protein
MGYLIGVLIGSFIRVAIVLTPVVAQMLWALLRGLAWLLVLALKLAYREPWLALVAALAAVTQNWVPDSPAVRVAILVLFCATVVTALAEADNDRPPKARRAGKVRTVDGRIYRFDQSDVSKRDQRRWAKARFEQARPHPRIAERAAHEARMRAHRAQAKVDRALALKEPKRSTFFSSPDFGKETNP